MSGSLGRKAMESALRTTDSGCRALLAREDSERIRGLCADRWQSWLFRFYPEFPDLAEQAEAKVSALGGSALELQGGRLMRAALPVVGWKRARRMQALLHRSPWRRVMSWKTRRRLKRLSSSVA